MRVEISAYSAPVLNPPDDAERSARLSQAEEEFEQAYLAAVELEADRAAAAELRVEALPALDAVLRWLAMGPDSPHSLLRSETLAMGSLLGRRAARLGVSPSAALGLVNGLLAPLRPSSRALSEAEHPLRAVCMEGYVAAAAERKEELRGAHWVEHVPMLPLAQHAILLVLEGERDAAQLTEVGERFARVLFRAEARVGFIDLTGLLDPSSARASALLGIDEGARTLGCPLVFSGVDASWQAALTEVGADFDLLRVAPSFSQGLEETLALVDCQIRRFGGLTAALRRLRRQ